MPRDAKGPLLTTVLFTDIVASTELADELGDRRWRELLSRHDRIVRRHLKRFGGREVDSAGDGFFCTFSRPADAIRCACAVSDAVKSLGVEIRVGLHVGEAEVQKGKPSGVTVHIGARALAAAGAGEVMVTSTLRDVVPGSGFEFTDHGLHSLKGIPGQWRLFEVASIGGVPRTPPVPLEESAELRRAIQPPPLRSRRLVRIGAVSIVVLAVVGMAWALSRGGSAPRATASTPIGELDRLVRVDVSTNRIANQTALPGAPVAVTAGEGSVWVGVKGPGEIVRCDADRGGVVATIPLQDEPTSLTTGDHYVWVTTKSGVLVRIDPTADRIDGRRAVGGNLRDVVVAFGWVWVTSVDGIVSRLDPRTLVVQAAIQPSVVFGVKGAPFEASLAAAGGAIWLGQNSSEVSGPNFVLYRIDAQSVHARAVPTPPIQGVARIAGQGPLWIISLSDRSLYREDLTSLTTASQSNSSGNPPAASVRLGGVPTRVAVDPDRAIWVANELDGTVWRIDPVGSFVRGTIHVDRSLTALAVGEGSVWLTIDVP